MSFCQQKKKKNYTTRGKIDFALKINESLFFFFIIMVNNLWLVPNRDLQYFIYNINYSKLKKKKKTCKHISKYWNN